MFTTQSSEYHATTGLGKISGEELFPLPANDAVEMLLSLLGQRPTTVSHADMDAAKALVGPDYFDGLPLAIEAAAASMIKTGLPLSKYKGDMSTVKVADRVAAAIQQVSDYAREEGLGDLMDIVAYVNPGGIPLWLLGVDVVKSVGRLTTLSILKWEGNEHVSIHRMYQPVLRQDAHISNAINAIYEAVIIFKQFNPRTWDHPLELLPHVRSLKANADVDLLSKENAQFLAHILGTTARVLFHADYDVVGARDYFQYAIDLKFHIHGKGAKNFDIAKTLINQEMVYEAMGDYESAKANLDLALDMLLHWFGPKAKNMPIATVLLNQGGVLRTTGDFEGAAKKYEEALQMMWEVEGRNAISGALAMTLHNQCDLLAHLKDYDRADSKCNQSLEMKWKLYGRYANTTDIASTISVQGHILAGRGKYEEAKSKYEQVLAMQWMIYGKESSNPDLAGTMTDLGSVLEDLGDFDGAFRKYMQAISMKSNIYDEENKVYKRAAMKKDMLQVCVCAGVCLGKKKKQARDSMGAVEVEQLCQKVRGVKSSE